MDDFLSIIGDDDAEDFLDYQVALYLDGMFADPSSDEDMDMDDEDTESYYDSTSDSSAPDSSPSVDTQDFITDDETMDAEIVVVEDISNAGEGRVGETNETENIVGEVDTASVASGSQPPSQPVEAAEKDLEPSTSAKQLPADISSTTPKRRVDAGDDDDDGQTCLICMEIWTNSGDHRLTSLRCGHLFGQSCITRWLQVSCSRNQKRCPQCNKPASAREIRLLYARKLIALDTAERDRLKEELEVVKQERNKLDLELKKSQLADQIREQQIVELKKTLLALQDVKTHPPSETLSQSSQQPGGTGQLRISLNCSVDINKEGGCRVLAYSYDLKMVVVSQRSTNTLFSGYGISKMNSLNFSRTQFVFLHTKQIRDLAFNSHDPELLLSVSLDRCAKLLDITSNNVVQNFQTNYPLWSCCWDANNSNIFYVGCQNGSVIQYDVRQTGNSIGQVVGSDLSPITSLVSIPSTAGGPLPRGGFLACHLNSCWAYEQTDNVYTGTQLPLEGPFVSMRYDRATEHMLVSSRPSTRSLRARHIVCELARADATNSLTCNPIQTFYGSTSQNLMSRACQMHLRGYGSIVSCYQESSSVITMWSMAHGQKVCNYPVRDPVLDLCPIYVNDQHYLGALSEKVLQVYKVGMN